MVNANEIDTMKNEENQQIGEFIAEIIANGFGITIFQSWRVYPVEKGEEIQTETDSGESPEPVPTPGPKTHIGIHSNILREKHEFNQRYMRGETLAEALGKAAKVSRFIVDNSKPVH